MIGRPRFAACVLLLSLTFSVACAPGPRDSGAGDAGREIAAAMERYMVAARAVNPDAIAAFYAPTAMLFEPGINPIQTRDSIRAFMA